MSGPIVSRTAATTSVWRVEALAHAVVGVGAVHDDLGLHGAEAEVDRVRGGSAEGVAVVLEAVADRQEGGVGGDGSRTAPPSRAWTGRPTALPHRSQSAMSTALMAWMTMPRRPFMAVPR